MGDEDRSIAARCACGANFTLEEWTKLDLAGVQEDDETSMLEMRNCPCGSTRARVVDFRAAVRLLNDETKRLRRALGLLRDIDRATAGLSHQIGELDRGSVQRALGGTRAAIEAGVQAVELERERCAKIAEGYQKPVTHMIAARAAFAIAAEIRKVP